MIVGRDAEIADVEGLFSRGREQPAGLLLLGEPGIGKSAIFLEAMRLGDAAGFKVLSSRAAASESGFALAALTDILEQVPISEREALPSPQRRALEVALHVAEPTDHPLEQSALAAAIRSLFTTMAAKRPLLLGLDDLQWLDAGSAAILSFVFRRLDGEPIAVLATQRLGEPAMIEMDTALPAGSVQVRPLRPLSLGALRTLLANRVTSALSRSAAVGIHEASRGNPLFAIELAILLAERPPLAVGDPIPVPRGVRDLVRTRVEALPERTRDILLAAALTAEPRVAIIEKALGSGSRAALEPAERSGIAAIEREEVTFSHPLHAAALVDAAPRHKRAELHGLLAGVVDEPTARARHVALAAEAPDESVASKVESGASAAARTGRLHAGAELLEMARALTPPGDQEAAHRRALRAAELHAHAGDRVRSRALVEELLTHPLGRQDRAEALQLSGELYLAQEDMGRAEAALAQALEYADAARGRATIRLILSYVVNFRLDFTQGAVYARQALTDLEDVDDDPLLAEALARSVMCDHLSGIPIDWDKLARALALADSDRMTLPGMGAAGVVAAVMMYAGRHAQSRDIMAGVQKRLAERGDEGELATAMLWTSWLETRAGNYAIAARAAEDALEYAKLTSNLSIGRVALAQRAYVDAHVGDVRAARRRIDEATTTPGVAFGQFQLWAAATRALVGNTLGDHSEAWEACRELVEGVERVGIAEPAPHFYLPDAIEALAGLGELDRAMSLTDAFDQRARAVGREWAIALAARCRGLVLAAGGDVDRALDALEDALAALDQLDLPFERARTLLISGSIRRRARQRAEARRAIGEAKAEFERLGAHLWARRAAEEFDRVGHRRSGAAGGLTPAEQRAVQLAAAGKSNKEIAHLLFVSVHTVELHLSHAYAKLGVSSRSQLRATAQGLSAPD